MTTYYRFRESDGGLYFEYSTDAGSWSVMHQRPTPFDFNGVGLRIGGGAYGAIDAGFTSLLDNVNLP